jgi:hypothetical protein
MTVNVDTYVLPNESNLFLKEVLPMNNPLRITWEVLSDEEKEGYLSAALRNIESLTYTGKKTGYGQKLKFPRTKYVNNQFGIGCGKLGMLSAPYGGYNANVVPDEIKRAQVYWAAVLANNEIYVLRRNNDACISLGIIKDENAIPVTDTPKKVTELLHNWVTNWRRV